MIRVATSADAEAILGVYSHYILHTAITYEQEVPSADTFRERIEATLETYPYLVWEEDGEILGYTYASRFHPRKSFDWAAEASVYIREDARERGLAPKLYGALEACLRLQGVVLLTVSIAWPEREDEYLTQNSVAFHAHMGYTKCAHFHNCASKFGRWYDLVWMEKYLCDLPPKPWPLRRFQEIRDLLML